MDNNDKEWAILVALFKATVEQQDMLRGQTRQNAKLIFNKWNKQGVRMLNVMEKYSGTDHLDKITDVIHDAVSKLR